MTSLSSEHSLVNAIAHRIRIFRKSTSGCETQKDFAAALGIDQQRLSGYENQTKVPHHVIAAMVRMGANPYWLLFGEGPIRASGLIPSDIRDFSLKALDLTNATVTDRQLAEFYILPLYTDEVAAGTPKEVRDTEVEGPAIIHRSWCPHPSSTDFVRVHSTGNSMEPTIPAGSMVTIDRSETNADLLLGKIVAIGMREGGVTLKRLQRDGRGLFIGVPDNNTNHTAISLGEGDRIIGVVRTVHARLS